MCGYEYVENPPGLGIPEAEENNPIGGFLMNIQEYLKERGVPSNLTGVQPADLEKVGLHQSYLSLLEYLNGGKHRVLLLTGTDSPYKDVLAVNILRSLVQQDKHVYYAPTSTLPVPTAMWEPPKSMAYAFMKADVTVGMPHNNQLRDLFLRLISRGKVLILGCESLDKLVHLYGESFVDYISHIAVDVGVSVKRHPIAKL